jgi:membrane protease YdiL (CAAX protease family)
MFPALADRLGPVIGAIITSLLFGLAHFQLNVSVYTVVLSLLLCMMYWRLRSIWPGIAFHMLNNYLVFLTLIKH